MLRSRNRKYLLGISFSIILLFIVPSEVSGHFGSTLSGFGTAEIDGKKSPGEWDGAAEISVFGEDLAGSSLFVMNDEKNLYLALSVFDETLSSDDSFSVMFDNSHNGVFDVNDDSGSLTGLVIIGDGYFNGENWTGDSTTQGVGRAQTDGTRNFIEYSKPLNTGDVNDLSLSIGDTVGFCVTYFKDGTANDKTQFGPACRLVINEQNLYGDILLVSSEPSLTDKAKKLGEDAVDLTLETGKEAVEKGTQVGQIVTEKGSEAATEIGEVGGCLIATATYGSELASQVQLLREVRDNTLLSTESGISFMMGFNSLYYSFSPTVADFERKSPEFRETVKLFITPMLWSLSIMTLADEGSESSVLGLGIAVMVLNFGMYIAGPALAGYAFKQRLKPRKRLE